MLTSLQNKDRIMVVEITVEEMMVVEETSKLAVGDQDDTYEFPSAFYSHGFPTGGIFDKGKLRSY